MKLTKKFFCPVNGWDCPYWKKDGSCSMIDEGLDPLDECDDAAYFWEEEDGCPCVWEDENGNRYDVDELLEKGYHFVNGEPCLPNEIWACGGCDDEISIPLAAYEKELKHAPRYVNNGEGAR